MYGSEEQAWSVLDGGVVFAEESLWENEFMMMVVVGFYVMMSW